MLRFTLYGYSFINVQQTDVKRTYNDARHNDGQRHGFEHAYEQLSPYPNPIDGAVIQIRKT